jgi:hypothetical protein
LSEALQYHRILLVRARPGSYGSRQALARAESGLHRHGARVLVFFHGAGVDHAADDGTGAEWRRLAGWLGARLEVCSGSWRRRHEGAPTEPFMLSSLVSFWHQALDAPQVLSFGDDHAG